MTSDDELIARVREALKQIPREILREPFPENPAIDEMKAIRSYSEYAAEEALDTLSRRIEELTEENERLGGKEVAAGQKTRSQALRDSVEMSAKYVEARTRIEELREGLEACWGDAYLGLLQGDGEDPEPYVAHAQKAFETIISTARSLLHPEPQGAEQ